MLTVVLRIFSGRPNPRWRLSDEQVATLDSMLHHAPVAPTLRRFRIGGLGYRGFQIDPTGELTDLVQFPLAVYGGTVDFLDATPDRIDAGRVIERWLLDSDSTLDHEIKELALKQFATIYDDAQCYAEPASAGHLQGRNPYDPGRWNNNVAAQSSNNCYSYATNHRFLTGSGAAPGGGGGQPVSFGTCQDFRTGALADNNHNLNSVPNGPTNGWPIAVFVGPLGDFHCYRQDDNGQWSHKPGGFPVRNCDESGQAIGDITSADTLNYTLCHFFMTGPFAKIKKQP